MTYNFGLLLTEDGENITISGLSKLPKDIAAKIVEDVKTRKTEFIQQLRKREKDQKLIEKKRRKSLHQQKIREKLAERYRHGWVLDLVEPPECSTCPAAVEWKWRTYANLGKICFHNAAFLGKPGKPVPCSVAEKTCPIRTILMEI